MALLGSLKLPAGTVNDLVPAPSNIWLASGVTTLGAVRVVTKLITKSSLTALVRPSVAVTRNVRVLPSAWWVLGLPLKVQVLALKLSQVGKAAVETPLTTWAVRVSVS